MERILNLIEKLIEYICSTGSDGFTSFSIYYVAEVTTKCWIKIYYES
jgi:hypothetical protein